MAIPIAAINAAIYGNKHNHNKENKSIDINFNKIRELYKKQNLILEYLQKKFKCKKVSIIEEFNINETIYRLDFNYYFIGVRISNELIIEASIEYLYNYSYDLIVEQLYKDTREKYIND